MSTEGTRLLSPINHTNQAQAAPPAQPAPKNEPRIKADDWVAIIHAIGTVAGAVILDMVAAHFHWLTPGQELGAIFGCVGVSVIHFAIREKINTYMFQQGRFNRFLNLIRG